MNRLRKAIAIDYLIVIGAIVALSCFLVAGCIAAGKPEDRPPTPKEAAKAEASKPPAEFTPHFGAVTLIDEVIKLKVAVIDLKNQRQRCDCECQNLPVWRNAPPGPNAPLIVWRVDPQNQSQLQYGYEAGGLFWVLSTMRAAN